MLQDDLLRRLTPRQKDVLDLLVANKKSKEIAAELNISIATVKAHVGAITEKFGVAKRKQIVELMVKRPSTNSKSHKFDYAED